MRFIISPLLVLLAAAPLVCRAQTPQDSRNENRMDRS
jgi:hypothetical protein